MRLRVVVAVGVILLVMGSVGLAQAQGQTISQVVVLGDSLSDNGNMYSVIGYPPVPHWQGRASNGPVAVEYLAQTLGVPLRDFAWIGATTGVGNGVDGGTADAFGAWCLPGMTTALHDALSAGLFPIDPDALYVVLGGANDLWTVTDEASAYAAVQKAVTNLVILVGELQSLGAQHILVVNMADLGKTPAYRTPGPEVSYLFTLISMGFNQALSDSLPPGAHYFDNFSVISHILANPSAYGLGNVTEQCLTDSTPCANPSAYFFWDGVHPTTTGHALVANAFYHSVAPTVVIGECDSGVPNALLSTGFTIWDSIAQSAFTARNHGQFVSAVASLTNGLIGSGVLSADQMGAIQRCVAK